MKNRYNTRHCWCFRHFTVVEFLPVLQGLRVFMDKVVIGNAELYLGDCEDILPQVNASVCLTSPPYNLGGFHQMHGGNSAKWEYDGCGDNLPEGDYQKWQLRIANMIADTGCNVLFYSHKNRIVDGRLISPLEWMGRSSWIVHQQVVLNKGSGANVDKRRFFPVHEVMLVCFQDSSQKLVNEGLFTDVWQVEQTNRKDANHPAVMPMSAAKKALSAVNDGVCLDPFMGSGTSAIAALDRGMRFIGIERSEKYFAAACQRVDASQRQGQLFA
jgi:modification methylase